MTLSRLPGFAISGKAGSGKSTTAWMLEEALWNFGVQKIQRLSFADSLKAEVLERTGLTKADPGGRDALLSVGKEMRGIDEDVFVNLMAIRMDLLDREVCPIIDDVRYPNEYYWCLERGMYLIRLEANSSVRATRLAHCGHEVEVVDLWCDSECGVDHLSPWGFHAVIENSGKSRYLLKCAVLRAVMRALVTD